jgi:hypothetical protein
MFKNVATAAQIAFFALFMSILTAPLVQTYLPFVEITPLREKQPQRGKSDERIGAIAAPLEWFQQHYGFREAFIRANSQINYSIFGISDRLHVGNDGWLYYRSVIDKEEPQVERYSDDQLDQAIGSIERLRDWLAERNIRLVVFTPQLKDKFYPQFLPYTARRALHRHRFDDYRKRLSEVPRITYIDTTPILEQLKSSRTVFHKSDFHWNDPAAFEIARIVVDHIATLEGRTSLLWHNTLSIETHDWIGGQANFMPLFWPPHEQALFVAHNWVDTHGEVDKPPEPFEIVSNVPETIDALPPIMVLADSFFDGMVRSGFLDYFRSVSRARILHAPVGDILRAIPAGTKYFVLEFIEIALPAFTDIPIPDN